MDDDLIGLLGAFASAPSLAEKWDAARRIMLDKRRGKAADHPLLLEGLGTLRAWADHGDGIDRLVAIDLLVRLPASIRKIKPKVRPLLAEAVREPLPPLAMIAEKRNLPGGAEPAEVRENVAEALGEATGEWVLPYAIKSLIEEDRSQRCRLALARQVAKRCSSICQWLEYLRQASAEQRLGEQAGVEASTARLRDICLALADVIGRERYRLSVSSRAGGLLASLARSILPLASQNAPPARLGEAGAALVRVLDELLAVRLTLMAEAELYEPLQLLQRWWSPLPYLNAYGALYRDASKAKFLHLMDGGLADNLGLRYLVGTVLNYGDNHDALRRAGRDHVRRVVLLSVDAGTSPIGAGGSYAYRINPRWQQERFIPPNDALLSALFGTEITNYNSGTMAFVNKKLDETVKELRRLRCEESSLIDGYSCGDVQGYFVHLALSDAPDPQMREQLQQIPTALTVPDEAVDRLVATGETLVRDSTILAEMRRSLEALP